MGVSLNKINFRRFVSDLSVSKHLVALGSSKAILISRENRRLLRAHVFLAILNIK